jgi:uncharacterized membrane protein
MTKLKKASLWLLIIFYAVAGFNHFINPEFYYPLIPDFLEYPVLINTISGIVEIVFAIGLFFIPTRKASAWGILLMLIAFIPSHVYFIELEGCVEGGLCTGVLIAWVRLIVVHPLLIGWAYWHTR